jgi:hypothetical protein
VEIDEHAWPVMRLNLDEVNVVVSRDGNDDGGGVSYYLPHLLWC